MTSASEAWAPTASLGMLKKRAQLYTQLRRFFEQRQVMELDVPALSPFSVTDVQLTPLSLSCKPVQYLQTSPEYYLKRLISRYPVCCYSLAKAYRGEEAGPRHRSEFTLLEWYRIDFDDERLMAEVKDLFQFLVPDIPYRKLAYADLFIQHVGVDPHRAALEELQRLSGQLTSYTGTELGRSECLDLLFSFVIEPKLGEGLTIVFDYPQCQSALARLAKDSQGRTVAKRFEVFCHALEIGNGYWELCDAQQQRQRFENDNAQRAKRGLTQREIDPRLMAALEAGMPACAGVAIGVDRLLMALNNCQSIADVISFADQ